MIGSVEYFLKSVWKDCNIFLALYIYFLISMVIIGISFIIFSLITGQVDTDNITWGLIDYV